MFVDDPQLTGGDQLHALARLDAGAVGRGERVVFRQRLADADGRSGFGEAVDLDHAPAHLALDALDRHGGGRRAGRHHAHAARQAGLHLGGRARQHDQHRGRRAHPRDAFVFDQPEHARGSSLGRQTCVAPAAVTVHVNVQPLAWNIGSVHR